MSVQLLVVQSLAFIFKMYPPVSFNQTFNETYPNLSLIHPTLHIRTKISFKNSVNLVLPKMTIPELGIEII